MKRAVSVIESLAVRASLHSAHRLLSGLQTQQQLHTSPLKPLRQTTLKSAHTVAYDQTSLLNHDLTQLRHELERAELLRLTNVTGGATQRENAEDLVRMYQKAVERAELAQLMGRIVGKEVTITRIEDGEGKSGGEEK